MTVETQFNQLNMIPLHVGFLESIFHLCHVSANLV